MKLLAFIAEKFGFLLLKQVKKTVYVDAQGNKYGVIKRG